MHQFDLRRYDLNLIKAFDALMRTGSVTEAADDMRVGQPAMSHSLSRLREMFNDELFVRTPKGMLPTKRAEELIVAVRRALGELEGAFYAGQSFDPAAETFQLTLGMSDYTEAVLLPALIQDVQAQAPNALIKVRQIELHKVTELIDEGRIDLAIGRFRPFSLDVPRFDHEFLFSDYRQCVFSKSLVGASIPISVDDYSAHPHIARSLGRRNTTFADEELAKLGKSRVVVSVVPRFSNMPLVLTKCGIIATMPSRMIKLFSAYKDLVASDLPFNPRPFDVSLLWHSTWTSSPAHQWLRSRFHEIAKV